METGAVSGNARTAGKARIATVTALAITRTRLALMGHLPVKLAIGLRNKPKVPISPNNHQIIAQQQFWMSCRRSNSGYRQLYRSPGNRWSVDLVLWPRIDLVAVFALGRLTSAPRRWEDRQFGVGSLDVSGTCAPGRAALSREGPRVRIPPPPARSPLRT